MSSTTTLSYGGTLPTEGVDRLLTEREAAELLGVRPGTLRTWRSTGRAGQPPFVRIGRAVRYRTSDCAEFIAELTEVSA